MASKSFSWQLVGVGGDVMVSLSTWWTTTPVTNANFVKQDGYFPDPRRPKKQLPPDNSGNGDAGEPSPPREKIEVGHNSLSWWRTQHPFYYPFVLRWKQLAAVMTIDRMFHIPTFHDIVLMLDETDTPKEKLRESKFKFKCKIAYHTLQLPIQPPSVRWSSSGYGADVKMIVQSSAGASYLLAVTSLFNPFPTALGWSKSRVPVSSKATRNLSERRKRSPWRRKVLWMGLRLQRGRERRRRAQYQNQIPIPRPTLLPPSRPNTGHPP